MTNFVSVNMLDSAYSLLRAVDLRKNLSENEISHISIGSTRIDTAVDFALKCKWIERKGMDFLVTARGEDLLCHISGNRGHMFRRMLYDYIKNQRPVWAYRIVLGRRETGIFLDVDTRASFYEAGLFSSFPDNEVVAWWDSLATFFREESDYRKAEMGRFGERMSLRYEKMRTQSNPKWSAIESNLLGYDITSQVSKDDKKSLFIEVKTTGQMVENGCFHLSSNEWSVAKTHPDGFLFHLWSITANGNFLAIVSVADMAAFIPRNQALGEWESVKIPYSSFSNRFEKTEVLVNE